MYKSDQSTICMLLQLTDILHVHVPVLERLPVLKNTSHSPLGFQTSSMKPALQILTEVPPNLSGETGS